MPSRPSLPASGISSRGSVPASNQSAMCGMTRSVANARTVSRTRRSSGVSWSSMRSRSRSAGLAGECGGIGGSSLHYCRKRMRAQSGCLDPPEPGMIGGMNDHNEPKRLIRTRSGRMVAGVCSGVAEYAGIDVTVVRVVLAALTVLTGGFFALVYLVAWIVIPEEGEDGSIAENLIDRKSTRLNSSHLG